jgi:hypothetical protein
VPFPFVAAAASASESFNAGGTGVPGLTAEEAATRRDTREKIDAFMMKLIPCKEHKANK